MTGKNLNKNILEEDNVFGKKALAAGEVTLRALLQAGTARLQAAGIEEARLDARLLLQETLTVDAAHFLLWEREAIETWLPDPSVRQEKLALWEERLSRREKREPLQQILGETEFYGLPFRVTKDVLCPRQDTETLVDKVIAEHENVDKSRLSFLDLCTGSGCIGITLRKIGAFGRGLCVDISPAALAVAEENAARNLEKDEKLCFRQSDLFAAAGPFLREKGLTGFDFIVSNPPYIRSAEISKLEPEVRDHEPHLALDGKEDGLYFYRKITAEAAEYLKPGGKLYLEIGYDQGEAVRELLQAAGFTDISIDKDLGGNDRVAAGRRKEGV